MQRRYPSERRGLGRIEMIVTMFVSGLFVTTMLPVVTGPSGDARSEALRSGLEVLRTQIELYRYEHGGRWPAAGTCDAELFAAALLEADRSGTGGPYIVGALPANPFNGSRSVRVVDTPELPEPDGTTGWLYSSTSGRIAANVPPVARVATSTARSF